MQLPKPTSFLAQCCLWEVSVLNQSKHGKARSNGFWKHFISKIWTGSTENKWNSSFPGFTTLGILDEIQKMMTESKCEPENFTGKIIFMSMYNDIDWTKRGNKENCIANAHRELRMLEDSREDIGHFLGLDRRRNGTELMSPNRMENGLKLLRT